MKTRSVSSNKKVLTHELSEPLNGATTATIDIHVGDGNLTIDSLTGGEQVLVNGTLEYSDKQGVPTTRRVSSNGQATLTLRGSSAGRPWFHFPWAACNGATEWQIHLNPMVTSDITARSDGGNVRLDLAGMAVSSLSADTGGGNMELVLPDNAANLRVSVRSGAGNVTVEMGSGTTGSNIVDASSGAGNVVVRIPNGVVARIQATTGMGKAIIDPQFSQINKNTYQSPDFDTAANKVEITAKSGAGNVSVSTTI
jgi:hypothetical protein